MKNIFWLPALLVISICVLTIGCKKDNCSNTINAVQPNTNPVGYEVLIKTTGFTSAAKVVFGSVAATSRAGGESGDIIARVPTGLSGNVEISVEEGDCIKRSDGFVVLGSLPSGVQSSLQNIIVPTIPTTPPTAINNFYINAATTYSGGNPEQTIVLGVGSTIGNIVNFDETFSSEFIKSVSSPISGFVNISTQEVQMVIDRTANGGSIEHFDGQYIIVPDFLPNAAEAILLVSRETGRQLLIYHN